MSGAIKAYDSRLHQSNQGPGVQPSLGEKAESEAGCRDATERSLFLHLALQQPKGDCKVYCHAPELLHLPNSDAFIKGKVYGVRGYMS